MDCEQALEYISAALDGELNSEEQAALRAHLDACPECRALSEDFGVLSNALSRLEQAPPPQLAENIAQALEAEQPSRFNVRSISSGKKKRRWIAAALSTAAVAVLAIRLGGPLVRVGSDSSWNAPAAMEQSGEAEAADGTVSGSGEAHAYVTYCTPEEADFPVEEPSSPQARESIPAPDENSVGIQNVEFTSDPEKNGDTFSDLPIGNTTASPVAPSAAPMPEPAEAPDPAFAAANVSLTQAEAMNLVFQSLGGYDAYPDAEADPEAVCYLLRPPEQRSSTEGGQSELQLSFDGLSRNGKYYRFWLYWLYTEPQDSPDSVSGHTATMNFYAVSLEDGSILAERPETGWDAEQAEEFHRLIEE